MGLPLVVALVLGIPVLAFATFAWLCSRAIKRKGPFTASLKVGKNIAFSVASEAEKLPALENTDLKREITLQDL